MRRKNARLRFAPEKRLATQKQGDAIGEDDVPPRKQGRLAPRGFYQQSTFRCIPEASDTKKMNFCDFGYTKQSCLESASAILPPSRISISDASLSLVDRREENLFVSEINFNDGVEMQLYLMFASRSYYRFRALPAAGRERVIVQ